MNPEQGPVVGRWYRQRGDEQVFQVVAIDETDGSVELQYFDGTVDELRLVQWYGLDIETSEAPQDWTGPFDGIVRDDLDATDTQMTPQDWNQPYVAAEDDTASAAAAEPVVDGDVGLMASELIEPAPAMEILYAKAAPRSPAARRRHH